ncbi:MAG: hypothetical protein QF741_02875 [Candidatus Peribacteraceae bacterium]|nr:hypothetical protein [Candidatus Peribacteraceae bacterium]
MFCDWGGCEDSFTKERPTKAQQKFGNRRRQRRGGAPRLRVAKKKAAVGNEKKR